MASAVWDKTQGKCFYCKRDLPSDEEFCNERGQVVVSKRQWHVDHVLPLSRGGDYSLNNLVPACSFCNLSKHDKTASEFMK